MPLIVAAPRGAEHVPTTEDAMKLDLRATLKPLYTASAKTTALIDVPRLKYLMIDGEGRPATPAFQSAIEALYGLTYTMKFTLKSEKPARDFTVMPLEGLWWSRDGEFELSKPDTWCWTLMIVQAEFITQAMITAAADKLRERRGPMPALERVRLQPWAEGMVVQRLHVGPYSAEPVTVSAMDDFARDKGLKLTGKHHEIYMSDPRRTAPEKIKTILRHPVKIAGKTKAAAG